MVKLIWLAFVTGMLLVLAGVYVHFFPFGPAPTWTEDPFEVTGLDLLLAHSDLVVIGTIAEAEPWPEMAELGKGPCMKVTVRVTQTLKLTTLQEVSGNPITFNGRRLDWMLKGPVNLHEIPVPCLIERLSAEELARLKDQELLIGLQANRPFRPSAENRARNKLIDRDEVEWFIPTFWGTHRSTKDILELSASTDRKSDADSSLSAVERLSQARVRREKRRLGRLLQKLDLVIISNKDRRRRPIPLKEARQQGLISDETVEQLKQWLTDSRFCLDIREREPIHHVPNWLLPIEEVRCYPLRREAWTVLKECGIQVDEPVVEVPVRSYAWLLILIGTLLLAVEAALMSSRILRRRKQRQTCG